MNLLDPGLMPYTKINGSTFPAPDPAIEAATPPVSDPNYDADIQTFIHNNAPNTFGGQPVNFGNTFVSTVTQQDSLQFRARLRRAGWPYSRRGCKLRYQREFQSGKR